MPWLLVGSDGAGGGPGYAKLIARAMVEAINRGLADLEHFEELGILEKGIGPDRISDLTCNILKSRFIEYTQDVATRHGIPVFPQEILNARYDPVAKRWDKQTHDLPRNPATNRPVLLTPERFIRDVPVLNADAWWDDYQAEQLRLDVNYEVLTNVDKATILANARRNAESVRKWTEDQANRAADARAYDTSEDKNGVYAWDPETRAYAAANPLTLPQPNSKEDFAAVIEQVIQEFKRYIESQRGWKLLWNDDGTEKHEEAAQLAFLGPRSELLQDEQHRG